MKALRVEGELHWGFWSRFPETSKMQSSFSIFPPTTLIGAIASAIFNLGILKSVGEVYVENKKYVSPAVMVKDFFLSVSAYFKPNVKGFSIEDINKYITLHFQASAANLQISPEYLVKSIEEIPSLSEEEKLIVEVIKEEGYIESSELESRLKEKLSKGQIRAILQSLKKKGIVTEIERRFLPKYRTGAILVGKTYLSGNFVAIYLLNEEQIAKDLAGELNKLVLAAWNITRIGSKESIASINNVELLEAKKIDSEKVSTILYFPRFLSSEIISGKYYIETFWEGGWGRDYYKKPVDYVVPGSKVPIESMPIEVKLSDKALAYQIKEEDEVLIVKR